MLILGYKIPGMTDICCVGHISQDCVITPGHTFYMPGGTALYFSYALSRMPVSYRLATRLSPQHFSYVQQLRNAGVEVSVAPSPETVYFENNYLAGMEARVQRVLHTASPFDTDQLDAVEARYYHLGPLLAGDIPAELIRELSAKGKLSLDVQGFLRRLEGESVEACDWQDKHVLLPLIDVLKVNETEMEVLTGSSDPVQAAAILHRWGAHEVVLTLGSRGALIADGVRMITIPAFPPRRELDATGCGDTFMAGYLCRRALGDDCLNAGLFASAMASLKMEKAGPFTGTATEVWNRVNGHA